MLTTENEQATWDVKLLRECQKAGCHNPQQHSSGPMGLQGGKSTVTALRGFNENDANKYESVGEKSSQVEYSIIRNHQGTIYGSRRKPNVPILIPGIFRFA